MTSYFDQYINKLLKESNSGVFIKLRGEYWFDEHGRAMYADGDVSAATQQLRKQEVNMMPDYYRNKNVIGDSFDGYIDSVIKT